MYLNYYGFDEQPFGTTPDPKYLYWSPSHREALASLYYAVHTDDLLHCFTPLGKTTLYFERYDVYEKSHHTSLFQTRCSSSELLRYILGTWL
jgi:general secretion pathway protein A